jgi:hypothetical protein
VVVLWSSVLSELYSREKLILRLKGSIENIEGCNDYQFIYHLGRNMYAESLLASIICGELDE